MNAEEAARHLDSVLSDPKYREALEVYGANIQAGTFRLLILDFEKVLRTVDARVGSREILQLIIKHLERAAERVTAAGKPSAVIRTKEPS